MPGPVFYDLSDESAKIPVNTQSHNESCGLCGLPVKDSDLGHVSDTGILHFCCHGCKQVFLLLSAASGVLPENFRDTELYKVCVESGIIPASGPAKRVPRGQGGLDIDPLEISCFIEGMWCPSCAWLIEEVLGRMTGIMDPKVSFVSDRLSLRYLPNIISPAEIISRIGRLGYRMLPADEKISGRERDKNALPLSIAAFLTANIMMASVFFYGFVPVSETVLRAFAYPVLIMSFFVIFWIGWPILKRGSVALLYGSASMDTLITVGAVSAFCYSFIHMAHGGYHVYFDTAAMLITLVLFGRYIEARARHDIRAGMADLYNMAKNKVRCVGDQCETWLAADKVGPGQHFTVLAEEMVPLDGRIIEGNPVIDESVLTGEARPRLKDPGEMVHAGSKLVQTKATFEAIRDVKESFVGQMILIIEQSLTKKNSYERLADRLCRIFVPIILCLSAGTGLFLWISGWNWGEALLRGLTVLLISCPCTLGIAIPLVKISAMTLSRRSGVVVRDPDALERLKGVDTVVFDKTGTVTEGNFSLQSIVCDTIPHKDLLSRLASIEAHSQHFIAGKIVKEAEENGCGIVDVDGFTSRTGLGVSGKVSGSQTFIGNRAFMEHNGFVPDRAMDADAGSWEKRGNTCVFFAWDRKIHGFLVFGDKIREGIPETISRLKNKGLEIWVVSGDAEITTGAIADQLSIKNFKGDVVPEEKVELVRSLQKQGRRVIMIGDGLNDTPALAAADASFAFGAGAGLIRESADVTFLGEDPAAIVKTLNISRLTNRTIRQNLFFAFLYNIVAIPIAIAGMLNPFIAVIAMVGSSLTVTGNVLRMSRKTVVN